MIYMGNNKEIAEKLKSSSRRVTQICIGRFWHFHLGRQLEKHGLLQAIYTGYPRFKLKDETGINVSKIHTFPWLHAAYMARGRLGLNRSTWLDQEWAWWAHETLDRFVSSQLQDATILIAISGSGLHAGSRNQSLGGLHICDRGSSHIRTQNDLLEQEYQRYGKRWPGIDNRFIEKEESEYEQADLISVPSQFCYDSFVDQGVAAEKLVKIPFGAYLDRFYRDIPPDSSLGDNFVVLFVGAAGPRKGFIDLISAFQRLSHPRKQLLLVGSIAPEAADIYAKCKEGNIHFVGNVPNASLRRYYSQASVFVMPSIEEGLALVIGEAMACGCPVVATHNTGASDLITDGVEGFIVPIRSSESIADRLQQLADKPHLRERMGHAALAKVQSLGSHVIEHMSNPAQLKEFADIVLKPDGIIILTCPNGSDSARLKNLSWSKLWGEVHPNYISDRFLLNLFADYNGMVGDEGMLNGAVDLNPLFCTSILSNLPSSSNLVLIAKKQSCHGHVI